MGCWYRTSADGVSCTDVRVVSNTGSDQTFKSISHYFVPILVLRFVVRVPILCRSTSSSLLDRVLAVKCITKTKKNGSGRDLPHCHDIHIRVFCAAIILFHNLQACLNSRNKWGIFRLGESVCQFLVKSFQSRNNQL